MEFAHFGDYLRHRRLECKITLRMIANRIGVEPHVYSRFERGVDPPSPDMLAAIAKALGITVGSVEFAELKRLAATFQPRVLAKKELAGMMPAFPYRDDGQRLSIELLDALAETIRQAFSPAAPQTQ